MLRERDIILEIIKCSWWLGGLMTSLEKAFLITSFRRNCFVKLQGNLFYIKMWLYNLSLRELVLWRSLKSLISIYFHFIIIINVSWCQSFMLHRSLLMEKLLNYNIFYSWVNFYIFFVQCYIDVLDFFLFVICSDVFFWKKKR